MPSTTWQERRMELDRLHAERPGLLRRGPQASFLLRWAWSQLVADGRRPSPPPPVPDPRPGECGVTFLGHATALIRYADSRILCDPCFAPSLYTMRRARPLVLPDGALDDLDVVLVSHSHADHLHRRSLELLERRLTLVVPAGTTGADTLGFVHVAELEPWQSMRVGAAKITAVPARHRVGYLRQGLALGYLVESDGPTVYFAGDTAYQAAFLEIRERLPPDIALLPISGYRPSSLRSDHLSPLDAIYAFEDLGAKLMIPIAHSAFSLGYEPIDEPLDWLRHEVALRDLVDKVAILETGASLVSRKVKEASSH